MSAAAPFPPQPPNGGAGGTSNSAPTTSATSNSGGERAYAHIDDLKQKALGGFKRDASVTQLLQDAEISLNQSRHLLEWAKRPDMAWVEYMRAAEIVVNIFPRHRGWADLQMDHGGGLLPKYQLLLKRVYNQDEQFRNIKEIIVNNNFRSGVQRTLGEGQPAVAPALPQVNGQVNGSQAPVKIRPTPSPKPEGMHGNAITIVSAGDALKDRLAALRSREAAIDTTRPDSRGSTYSSIHSSPTSMSMSNPGDFGNRGSFDALSNSLSRTSMGSNGRPQGPRGMLSANGGPPVPGKLPLNTAIASMPQEPKATYSPARNMQAPGNIELPRQTPRSQFASSSRKSSMVVSSSASSQAPNTTGAASETGDYFPSLSRPTSNTNGIQPSALSRRKSANGPETSMSSQQLYDFLERFNILLIDFRSRQDFDLGHIFHRSIICIDPIHVTEGMSADELFERMVISPDNEQEMFVNRDKYDLVVYYDAGTQNESFLTRPTTDLAIKLRALFQALHEFSHDKPLQRPPILLMGGIESWSDLVGSQALATSDTASRSKVGRPLQRRPIGGPLQPPKRRLREYNPLDDNEARKWRERARAESVVLQPPPPVPEDDEEAVQDDGEETYSAIDDFNERFPDAGQLEKHAFGPLRPTRAAPEPPPKVPLPNYPAAMPASVYPTVPARPQPAAPRPSYTGVADRAGSQNIPPARSSTIVPYIPAKYLSSAFKIPRTGLHNYRFTCYMNATLQALSATKPFSIYFMEDGFRKHLQPDNWKGTRGIMPSFYSTLIRSLWSNDVSYIKPTTFRQFCGRQKRDWVDDSREHDAKEFYDFLIDFLHEDLNVKWSHPPDKPLTPAEEARRERMPPLVVAQIEWAKYQKRNQSFPSSLFAGQYSSHVRFPQCGHTSTSHEAFYSLSVEIPNLRGRQLTLDDCLRSFCKEETLTEEEWAKCEQCNERKDTRKRITITHAPQVLVLHFKRFGADRRRQHKVATPIHFPLDNLDIGPYMLPQPTRAEADVIANQYSPAYLNADPGINPPYTYSAYAIVRHHGTTIESGHYTALVRDLGRPTWRCFNDSSHQDFQPGQPGWTGEKAVTNGQAYIVFYQRNPPIPATANVAPIGPGGVGKI